MKLRVKLSVLLWGTAVSLLTLFIFYHTHSTPVLAEQTSVDTLLPYGCGQWFFSGVNIPWQNGGYGADFGTVEEWGQHTYSASATETMFAELSNAGVNSVRWWLFTDGRGAPEFNANSGGSVTGLDANFLPSMASAIQLAQEYDLYLVFTLWDFSMVFADGTADSWSTGQHAGMHGNLITNNTDRQSFINNALLPMLDYPVGGYTIGTHPNVLAWEIINEPEWIITNLNALDGRAVQPVTLAQMHRFVAELSSAIHQNSNQMVTVGSASLKWNSDTTLGADGNFWSDADLSPYAADGTLDFYQIHYYGWMNGDGVNWSYSPLFNSVSEASLDKPTIVGEFPANAIDTGTNLSGLLNGIYNNGYAGAWTWSYDGVDGNGGWSNSETAMTAFNQAHQGQTAVTFATCSNHVYLPSIVK
jgi:hypothetical protein